MHRRTLICVSFAVALHGAAFLALDRFWFFAAINHPPVERDSVIELIPPIPDLMESPVARAEVLPSPTPAPVVEPEPQPGAKPETRIEPKLEPKTEVKPEPVVQSEPALLASKAAAVVASVAPVVSFGSASATVAVNASVGDTAVNSSPLANNPTSIVSVATQPRYLSNPEPDYPLYARLRKQEGVVYLAVEVNAKGRPSRIEVETSSGFKSLDMAAVKKVHRWSFEPARRDGIPVAAHVQVPVRFQLDD